LKKIALFGVIEGGYNMHQRERSAKETVARNVDGRHTLDISFLSNFIGHVVVVIIW
jgi:queuine/archaeosine tRNA-ribosyltransferase